VIKGLEVTAERLRQIMDEESDDMLLSDVGAAWDQIMKSQEESLEKKNCSIDIVVERLRRAKNCEGCSERLSQEISAIIAELANIRGVRLCQA